MSKTYTLNATSIVGGMRSAWLNSYWTGYKKHTENRVGGYSSGTRFATYIMFDQTQLATLRSKTVSSITLNITIASGRVLGSAYNEIGLAYKLNNQVAASSENNAWERGNANSTEASTASIAYLKSSTTQPFDANNTPFAFNLTGTSVPVYGYVIGPDYSATAASEIIASSATLVVVTNETDYELTFNANGGSGAPAKLTGTGVGSYTFTIPSTAPTRTGYTFLGWSTSSSATSASYQPNGSIAVSANTTLYAVWKITQYTIGYNANGGTGAPSAQTKNYGTSITLSATKPSRSSASAGSYTVTYNANGGNAVSAGSAARTTSYAFSKWNTASDGSGTSYNPSATYSANASATLYAIWSGTTSTAAVTLPTPTRSNYSFNGWYTAASGGVKVGNGGASYTPTGNVTLYAQWTALSATLSSVTSSVDCGNNLTGSWTSTGATYKYKLKVTCGNAAEAWSSLTAANAHTASVTIPTSWYSMSNGPLRDATSTTATCTLYTYASDGTTQIGTASSKTFTVKVPTNVVPTLSTLTAAASSDNPVVSGWGQLVFVQGYSKVSLAQTVSSYNGSRFSSVRYYGPGLDSTMTSLTASDESSVINQSGTLTYTATVTDTRGRSASKTVTVTFQPYAQPSVSGIAVMRCDSDGTTNNAGGLYFKATPTYSFSSVSSKNALQVQTIKYRVHPSGAWSTAANCVSGTTYGPWSSSLTSAYDVMVTLADKIQNAAGQTTTFMTTLPTVQGVWIGKGNDRLGLGGVPPSAGLHCDWDATFNGVLDVTPRRCYATLSTPGWYRVLTYNATSAAEASSNLGRVFDFTITRTFSTSSNEVHKISLLNPYNAAAFIGEESYSHVLLIDKIRATVNSTDFKFNVDIHYVGTSANRVTVDYVMHTEPTAQGKCVATGLVGVADSPNNETEFTPYTFAAGTNGTIPISNTATSVGGTISVPSMSKYRMLLAHTNTSTSNPIGTRGVATIPITSLGQVNIPVCTESQSSYIRVQTSGDTLYYTASGISGMYILNLYGIV